MAKSKKQKKRNKQYPPLSKVDKILYGVPTIFFLAVYPFTFFAFDFILPEIYLRDGVIAYSPENPFPSFLLLIVTFIFFIIATDKQNKRIPIFGNSSVDYYNTINYRFVLPPFDKRYSKQNKDNKSTEKELIKINTICKVVGVENNEKNGLIVGIIPERELPYNGYGEFWYLEKDVEKGHMEWVREG